MNPCKLEAVRIRKEYPGTVALENVSITFEGGNVHALIGKNGAGKSTLVKILAGAEQPTAGTIRIDGQEIRLASPAEAFKRGIATVYQELSLVPGLSAAENILLGRLPKKKNWGSAVIDWKEVYARVENLLSDMQVDLDLRKPAGTFGVAQQQVIEIAKAMSFNPSVLMLDEPTSSLARHETAGLFALLRKLQSRGVAIIYISHRLQELKQIANRISVLRDGKTIGTLEAAEATPEKIVQMMFGETVQKQKPVDLKVEHEPVLEVRNLSRKNKFHNIHFTLYKKEILGVAGMLGSGRTELLKSIFGAEPFDAGEIIVNHCAVNAASPYRMKKNGVALVPENRKEEALIQRLSVRQNLCLAGMADIAWRGLISRSRENTIVEKMKSRLQIKLSNAEQPVSSLSGGNQQKVVIGNWLNTLPRIILFDEPTRGIDVQAKQQIFQIMWDLSREGISSVFVSTELEELVEVCHRILIMKHGRIAGEVQAGKISAEELYILCMEEG